MIVTGLAIFLIFGFLINASYTLFVILSFIDLIKRKRNYTDSMLEKSLNSSFYRPISLIVPAFNESKTIVSSLKSQLNIDYAEYEVIVVNDGSKDETLDVLKENFELFEMHKPIKLDLKHQKIKGIYFSLKYKNLIVIDKENGGKFDAINCGINVSNYPFFCVIDADSLLEPDSLLRAGSMFAEDHTLVAVGGTIRPSNGCVIEHGKIKSIGAPNTFIELVQSIEYIRGFLIGRSAWNMFKSLIIISGAFGIFKKDIVKNIGGYRHTVGEDMDLVIRMHKYCLDKKLPYKILNIPDTICWTQVPNDYTSLGKQRKRWQRGLIDCLVHNREMLFNPKYKTVGLIGLPYFLLVEAIGSIVEFLGYFILLFAIFNSLNIYFIVLLTLFMILWTNIISIIAVFFDNLMYRRYKSWIDLFKLIIISFFENLGYRQYISYHRFIGTLTFLKKEWGIIKRSHH